jgi:hypothetical protein
MGTCGGLGFIHITQNRQRALMEQAAFIRQREAARTPIDEPHAQPRLHGRQAPAYRRQ